MKSKEKNLSFSKHSKRENQLFSQKFPFSYPKLKYYKQTFSSKEIFVFLYLYKTLKTINKTNFEIYKT